MLLDCYKQSLNQVYPHPSLHTHIHTSTHPPEPALWLPNIFKLSFFNFFDLDVWHNIYNLFKCVWFTNNFVILSFQFVLKGNKKGRKERNSYLLASCCSCGSCHNSCRCLIWSWRQELHHLSVWKIGWCHHSWGWVDRHWRKRSAGIQGTLKNSRLFNGHNKWILCLKLWYNQIVGSNG